MHLRVQAAGRVTTHHKCTVALCRANHILRLPEDEQRGGWDVRQHASTLGHQLASEQILRTYRPGGWASSLQGMYERMYGYEGNRYERGVVEVLSGWEQARSKGAKRARRHRTHASYLAADVTSCRTEFFAHKCAVLCIIASCPV